MTQYPQRLTRMSNLACVDFMSEQEFISLRLIKMNQRPLIPITAQINKHCTPKACAHSTNHSHNMNGNAYIK